MEIPVITFYRTNLPFVLQEKIPGIKHRVYSTLTIGIIIFTDSIGI